MAIKAHSTESHSQEQHSLYNDYKVLLGTLVPNSRD